MTSAASFAKFLSMRNEDEPFTSTEVGALIESFRNDVSIIAERLIRVEEKVDVLQVDVNELKTDMRTVRDVLRIEIPSIHSRLTSLEARTA